MYETPQQSATVKTAFFDNSAPLRKKAYAIRT
jgi:hypothetical protein